MEYLELVKGKELTRNNPFDGIDTQMDKSKRGAPIGKAIEEIIDDFDFSAPFKSVVPLLEVKSMILELQDDHWKSVKIEEVDKLILNCLGMELQLNANMPYGVLGEDLQIKVLINNPSPLNVILKQIKYEDKQA